MSTNVQNVIKRHCKNVLEVVSYSIGLLLPIKFIRILSLLSHKIYSSYIKKQLNCIGQHFYIEYPCQLVGGKYISVGNNFSSFARLRIEAFDRHVENIYTPRIVIGENVSINYDCHIGCVNYIEIGSNVLIASRVFITDHFHGDISRESLQIPPSFRKVVSKGPVIIKENVWIGEGVAIMPNVTIGKNSIIGANSIVTKDVPPYSVVGGIPAKIIKRWDEE